MAAPKFASSGLSLLTEIGVLLCGAIAHAQSFSADLRIAPRDGAPTERAGKLYVFGSKVRLETSDLSGGYFLIDVRAPSACFVRPAAQLFMDAKQSSRIGQWLVPVDPENPCRQWQVMAKLAGAVDQDYWNCEPLGNRSVEGRGTIGFRAIVSPGHEFAGWIDAERKFPVRIRAEDGAIISVENIRDEPLSAQLFELATGLRKFDPRLLIERIKQSDVWVEEPKSEQLQ